MQHHGRERLPLLLATVAVALSLVTASCSRSSAPRKTETTVIVGPSAAGNVAAQPGDLPEGLRKCDYSGPMDAYIANIGALGSDVSPISGTWKELQAAGAIEGYVAVYADTPDACRTWIVGIPDGEQARRLPRIVSTVVVRYPEVAVAEAAYRTDIFKQSQLTQATDLRVLTGPATKLSANAAIGADEKSNPTMHQAVWQKGRFNLFFTSRDLTRAEFESATSAESRRAE